MPTGCDRRARRRSSGASRTTAAAAIGGMAAHRLARDRRSGPVRPGVRLDPVPREHAGRLGRSAGRGPDRRDLLGIPVVPDQRRSRVRARGAAPGRRSRGVIDGRADPWDGRRRRHRHRRTVSHLGHDGTGGEVGHRDRSTLTAPQCGCGEPQIYRGLRARRPDRRGVRHGTRPRPRSRPPGMATRGHSPVWPRSANSSASRSPT